LYGTCLPCTAPLVYRVRVTAAGPKAEALGGGYRVGDTLAGRYVLERKLGRGGMGIVVAARRLADGQPVAVKLLIADATDASPKNAVRLIREAKATAALTDENVVRLYDVDTLDDGMCFLVMELLDGEDLHKVVRRRGPLSVTEAVDLILQASAGVAEAHARGIVHRDLKPHNLFLARRAMGAPVVKVLDFGISKFDGDDTQLTTTGSALGSPQYMAIEQFQNSKNVDRRADIWALGMILHYLLTGRTAYEAPDVATYLFRLSTELPTPLRLQRPDVPAEIEAAVLRCLEKNPNARFGHVGEWAQSLAPFAGPTSGAIFARIRHYVAFMPPVVDVRAPQENLRRIGADSPQGRAALPSLTNGAVARENDSMQAPNRNPKALVGIAALSAVVVIGLAALVFLKNSPEKMSPVSAASPSTPMPAANQVVITVAVNPPQATIAVDGQRVKSPFELPQSEVERTLVVQADGYVSKTKLIRPMANAYLEITLEEISRGAAGPVATAGNASPSPLPAPGAPPAATTNKKKLKGPMTESL